MVTTALSVGLAGQVISFFIPAMRDELGIAMVVFGIAISCRQVAFALASPFLGRLIDRHGARWLLVVAGVVSGVAVMSLGSITAGWQLIVLIAVLGLVGLQGSGGDLYGSVVIAKWFREDRGRALSIAFLGMPLGVFFISPLTQYWIETLGWRTTWEIYGGIGGALFVTAALFVRQGPPEEVPAGADANSGAGHEPEVAKAPIVVETPSAAPVPQVQWTRAEAMRTRAFWVIAISFGVLMFTVSTVGMFRVPHFIDQGIAPEWVALAFSTEAVMGAVVALPVGWLIDKFELRYLTAGAYSIAVVMLLITIYADSNVEAFLAMAVFGVGGASNIILQNAIWPHYFGTTHVGAIRGAAMPITLAFAVMGAPVAGLVHDATGSFAPIWWTNAFVMFAAMYFMATTRQPQYPAAA